MSTTTIQLAAQRFFISQSRIEDTSIDFLTVDELEIYHSFKLDKRKREWLAGRRAAKESVRALLPDTTEGLEILTKSGGEPYVRINGKARSDIPVSISHSNEVALAAAGRSPIIGLGIDVEVVEGRASSFLRTAFTPAERTIFQGISDDHVAFLSTSLYTMKEAATKALGIGLSVNTYDVELLLREGKNIFMSVPGESSLQSGGDLWNVVLHKEAKARLTEIGGGRIIVKSPRLSDIFEMEMKDLPISKKYAMGLAVLV